MIKSLSCMLLILLYSCATIQSTNTHITLLTSGHKTSIRGLSVVNDSTVWVSGSNGTVARSTNGGTTWHWMQVKGFEANDFRDIHAFDEHRAIIMAIGEPAYILKTENGGADWKVVFTDSTKGMFLDAMHFRDDMNGHVVGDPVNGRFFIATTNNSGNSWQTLPYYQRPVADTGEACFAASGTNIISLKNGRFALVSGGTASHFITESGKVSIPVIQGHSSTGANSLAIHPGNARQMIIAGGDFSSDTVRKQNMAITIDGGKTWLNPTVPPGGYRSCVDFITKQKWITCGTSGVDISNDGGKRWKQISRESFHVCQKARNGTSVFLAGSNGRIAILAY